MGAQIQYYKLDPIVLVRLTANLEIQISQLKCIFLFIRQFNGSIITSQTQQKKLKIANPIYFSRIVPLSLTRIDWEWSGDTEPHSSHMKRG